MPLYMPNREDIRFLDGRPLPANTASRESIYNRFSGNASNPNRILNLIDKHKAEVRSRMTNPEQGLEAILRERQSTYDRRSSNAYTSQNPTETRFFDNAINGRSSESIRRPSTHMALPESLRYGVSAAGAVNERPSSEERFYIPSEIEVDDDFLPSVLNQARFQSNQDVVVAVCETDEDDDVAPSRSRIYEDLQNPTTEEPAANQSTNPRQGKHGTHGRSGKSRRKVPPDDDNESPHRAPSRVPSAYDLQETAKYKKGSHRKQRNTSLDSPDEDPLCDDRSKRDSGPTDEKKAHRKKRAPETEGHRRPRENKESRKPRLPETESRNEDLYEPENPQERVSRNLGPTGTTGNINQDQENYVKWILPAILFLLASIVFIIIFATTTSGKPPDGKTTKRVENWETPIMYHEPIF